MKLRLLLIFMCLAVSMIPVGIISSFAGFQFAAAFLLFILIVTLFVAFFISYFISHPLEKLTKNIDDISKGNLDVKLEKSEIYEINRLTQSLDRVMVSLKLAIKKVGVKKDEIFEKTARPREELEEKYSSLLNNIGDWIWETDSNGTYVSCSPQIAYLLGYNPKEVIGKSFFDFVPSEEANKVELVFDKLSRGEKSAEKLETYYVNKDGHKVYVLLSVIPIFDDSGAFLGYRGIQRDITRYKQFEKKIEELTKEFSKNKKRKTIDTKKNLAKDILNKGFDSMFIFDEQLHIVDCNETMHKQLGYTKEEMLSLNVTDFDIFENQESIRKKIKEIKEQGSINIKTIHKRKDGSSILVSENIQYLEDQNRFKCFVREDSF